MTDLTDLTDLAKFPAECVKSVKSFEAGVKSVLNWTNLFPCFGVQHTIIFDFYDIW